VNSELGTRKAERVPRSSLLLLGPTGAGKTPLGDYLERQGLHGRRCVHFDFGAQLRRAAETGRHPRLADGDLAVIRQVLAAGALLENEHFRIAKAILVGFITERDVSEKDLVVLNGLPRHVDQALQLGPLVRVRQVAVLQCEPDVVRERIRLNVGGDRTRRRDDTLENVARKLAVYRRRTLPLIEYYRQRKARVCLVDVRATTTPAEVVAALAHPRAR